MGQRPQWPPDNPDMRWSGVRQRPQPQHLHWAIYGKERRSALALQGAPRHQVKRPQISALGAGGDSLSQNKPNLNKENQGDLRGPQEWRRWWGWGAGVMVECIALSKMRAGSI
ncbi:hypothetical protein AAY473_000334 [Plecturocebus cupreus]